MLPGCFTDFGYPLNRSNLIVCIHNSNENSGWFNSGFQFFSIDKPFLVYPQVSYICAQFLQVFATIQHSFVFNAASNNMIAFYCVRFKYTFNCKVSCLGCTGSENDLVWLSTNQFCHLLPGKIYRFLG